MRYLLLFHHFYTRSLILISSSETSPDSSHSCCYVGGSFSLDMMKMTPLKSIIDIPIHRISTENLKKFCRLYKVNNFMCGNIKNATRPILCNAICQAKESYVETQIMMHIEIDEEIDVPSSDDDTPVVLLPGSAQWHDIHNNELIVLQEVDAEYLSNGQKQSVSCEI